MKTLLSIVMLLVPPGGERERGLEHYRAGRYQEAQLEFQAAVDAAPESAELQWNLALAAWRAGDLATAELAADKYAALDKQAKVELHRGLLGAVRFAEAEQLEVQAEAVIAAPPAAPAAGDEPPQPLPLLERALQKAQQAKQHFVAAARAEPTPEALRNVERAARKIEQLKKRLEELSKQQDQQQKQDGDQPKEPQQGDENKDQQQQDGQKDDQQQNDQQKSDQQKGDEQQNSEQKNDEQKNDQQQQQPGQEKSDPPQNEPGQPPEPRPGEQEQEPQEPKPQQPPQPEPQQPQQGAGDQQESGDQQPKPGEVPPPPGDAQDQPRGDAPGEQVGQRELTPEQEQRLRGQVRDLDQQLKELRARLRRGRQPVERDW